MKQKLSDELINISSLLMLARDRGEIISLAGELNKTICKAMEIEKASTAMYPQEKKKTLSATIKFSKGEIEQMSKTFKKEFIANGCVSHIIKRQSGKKGFYYEIRYRRNGYNISVSNVDLNTAKALFIERTKNLQPPEAMQREKLKFGTIINEWLEYKKNKVILSTWKDHVSLVKRFIPTELQNKQIKDIHTTDIDKIINFEINERTREELRSLFNQIFKFAIANGIISHNPVMLIPFKRAERKNREALNESQIKAFLTHIKEPQYDRVRQCAYVLYFFGVRPCELDNEARFENGFLICRNRKRKSGKIEYKKIPIPKQAREFIDFNKPITYPKSYNESAKIISKAIGNGFTPYNLRHTFASICAETVKAEVLDTWMGDSPERLVGRVYVHYSDKFMSEQMNTVNFITL